MAILITGAGMIGAHVAAQLLERDETPILFDSAPPMDFLKTVLDPDKVKIIRGDILNMSEILHVIKEERIERIIHTAGLLLSGVRERPYAGIKINIMGTMSILEAARIMDIERVVFASTTLLLLSALKADSKGPFHEDFPMNCISQRPKNIYPITKLTCEYLGLSYHDFYGVDFITVRFSSVFGPWLGVTSGIPGRTIDQFVKPAVTGKPVIIEDTMLSYAGGSDFIYSKDAAKSCVCACFADSSNVKLRIYNVTGGQFITFRELIDMAQKVFPDAQIEVRQISELGSARTPYPKYEPTDISRAREEIGYIPDYDMESALRDYADWLRKYYI